MSSSSSSSSSNPKITDIFAAVVDPTSTSATDQHNEQSGTTETVSSSKSGSHKHKEASEHKDAPRQKRHKTDDHGTTKLVTESSASTASASAEPVTRTKTANESTVVVKTEPSDDSVNTKEHKTETESQNVKPKIRAQWNVEPAVFSASSMLEQDQEEFDLDATESSPSTLKIRSSWKKVSTDIADINDDDLDYVSLSGEQVTDGFKRSVASPRSNHSSVRVSL